MEGFIDNLQQHIIPIILLTFIIVISLEITFRFFCKCIKKVKFKNETIINKSINNVKNITRIIQIVILLTSIILTLVCITFLSNPLETKGRETITTAEPDSSIITLSKEEIKKLNREVIKEKSNLKKEEAEKDNYRAMDEIDKIFKNNKKSN